MLWTYFSRSIQLLVYLYSAVSAAPAVLNGLLVYLYLQSDSWIPSKAG
jgi:hypothetical protein